MREPTEGAARDQRVAVVTGGAGAIGSAVVAALEASGHRTVVIDRAAGIACDLSSEESTRQAAEEVLAMYGRCDVLVHCAGMFDPMPVSDFNIPRWRTLMAVHIEAPLLLAQAFAPGMIARGFGRFLFITSDGQWLPMDAEFLPYVTSKAALNGLMRNLAVTFGGDGIAAMAVAPGLTDTPLARSVVKDGAMEAVVDAQVLKRALVPADVAHTVAFLASEGAEALTGQILVPNGGAYLY
ncbi:SDR family NAD(P)-dependent oxidoreductase [Microbacterium sp. RD1]|uniref:SDR family NAD(P)-dependent oxidoreductase n=1 Tax=Microbacterium sp. RD1 TaxID=3457313 RepID=UPI003FA54F20